jgi:hypothetical protein
MAVQGLSTNQKHKWAEHEQILKSKKRIKRILIHFSRRGWNPSRRDYITFRIHKGYSPKIDEESVKAVLHPARQSPDDLLQTSAVPLEERYRPEIPGGEHDQTEPNTWLFTDIREQGWLILNLSSQTMENT